jgi:hypothetical protein
MDLAPARSPSMSYRPPAALPRRLTSRTLRLPIAMALAALGATMLSSLLAASIQASLDATLIFANEQATLTLVIENARPAVAPRPAPVPGLQFRALRESYVERTINGQRSTSLTYPYSVQATQPGNYTIPPVRIRIAGQEFASAALRLKVLPAEVIDPQQQSAFLRLVVPRTNLFVGEILPIEIRLYARHGSLRDIPQLQQEGLTLGRLNQHPVRKSILAGLEYSLVAFESYISPARSGRLTLGPAQLPMNLPVPGGASDFFGRPREFQQVLLPSQSVALNVAPLPSEGRPADFNGAVGDYSFSVRVSTNVVTVGDPITLNIQIAGHGLIEPLQLPSLDHWTEFRVYPPVTRVSTSDPFGVQGVKTFDQVVIPKSHQIQLIPPLSFSFFHPESRSYRTLEHPATPITVQPAHPLPPPTPGEPSAPVYHDPHSPEPGLAHIKHRLGPLTSTVPPLLTQPWFLAAQSLPVAAFLTALLWRRHQDRLAANPQLQRRRHVDQLTRQGIRELRHLATRGDATTFFALLARLLQEQLGRKLQRPAAAITDADLECPLEPLGLSPDHLQLLRHLFQLCNQSRFAPRTTPAELNQLLPRAVSLLEQLNSHPTPKPS